MTAYRVGVEVQCDGPGDERECPENMAWMDAMGTRELRALMRTDGWETGLPGGIDRCPICVKEARS
jgi:hypothetical protein